MDQVSRARDFTERRLDRACRHLEDLWLPVNAPLLVKIQSGLETGKYQDDVAALVQEIRGDIALFTYCLRKLMLMLKEEGHAAPLGSSGNPVELLRQAGLERLKAILAVESRSISPHSLQELTPLQIARFQEVLVCTSTSEVLAESFKVDSDLAFSAALLRQLGYCLITWNYPELYERATQLLKDGLTLDQAISQLLGFSPLLLGVTLLYRWGFEKSFCAQIALPEEIQERFQAGEEEADITHTLALICLVGETLARANNPKLYPTARKDWMTALREIERRLGGKGLELIQERFQENCGSYLLLAPKAFEWGLALDPELHIAAAEDPEHQERNLYLPLCLKSLRRRLALYYQTLPSDEVSTDCIAKLVKEIIPAAGFQAGCVYTVDPGTSLLMPRLAVGQSKLSEFQPLQYWSDSVHSELVVQAFNRNTVCVAEELGGADGTLVGMAGVLGLSQRLGVLYLELVRSLFLTNKDLQLVHFRALIQALIDSLGLETPET